MSGAQIIGTEELDLFFTLCETSGIKVEYIQNGEVAETVCVPYKVRPDRLDFGVPLYTDSRIFLFRKSAIPEPQPKDLIKHGADAWRVSAVPDGPHYVEHGRYGHIIKVHARKVYDV
ncbi:MAG: hypothetical protein ACRC2T_12365 [Thermoguttaceae bacterium]